MIGLIINNFNIIENNKVINGVIIKFNIFGIIFLSVFWVLVVIILSIKVGNIEFWYFIIGIVILSIERLIGVVVFVVIV